MGKERPARADENSGGGTLTLTLRIQPRASKNGLSVMEDGSCKVRLTAPPVDGAANEALVRYLADLLSVGRSQIEILSGHTGRQKIVRISGVNAEEARRVLNRAV